MHAQKLLLRALATHPVKQPNLTRQFRPTC